MGKPRLLLAEDDDMVRALLRDHLEASGFEVTTAATGPVAIQRVESAPVPFEIVVSDFELPAASGVVVCEAARRRSANTLLLIMSGYPLEVPRTLEPETGEILVLQKPFLPGALVERLRGLIQKSARPKGPPAEFPGT